MLSKFVDHIRLHPTFYAYVILYNIINRFFNISGRISSFIFSPTMIIIEIISTILFVSMILYCWKECYERPEEYKKKQIDMISYEDYPIHFKIMSNRIFLISHFIVVVLTVISFLCNIGVNFIGDFQVEGQEKLQEFIYNRDKDTPLITCCNHIDAFDDPVIISATIGWKSILHPSYLKCSLSAEEYCFKSPAISEFFTFGRIMPIKRGSGIYQLSFLEFIQRLKFGDWLHIFPEGRTLQDNGCPKRDDQGRWFTDSGRTSPPWRHLGPLKWGIGKMIADSPNKPLVVPFYHKGLDKAWPHDDHNHVKSIFPYWNTRCRVKVGDPINYDDILDEYNSDINKITDEGEKKVRNERLYKDLTDRIEEEMAKLEPAVLEAMKE